MPPNCEVTSMPSLLAIQLPLMTKQGRSGWVSSGNMSPGRTPAMSTHPPSAGAVYVVEKKDSPQSTERLSPFMMPPLAALLEICTPGECAGDGRRRRTDCDAVESACISGRPRGPSIGWMRAVHALGGPG